MRDCLTVENIADKVQNAGIMLSRNVEYNQGFDDFFLIIINISKNIYVYIFFQLIKNIISFIANILSKLL